MTSEASPALPDAFTRWFEGRGWQVRDHQLELLRLAGERRSVLLVAPTGAGKTLAGFLPTLVELGDKPHRQRGLHTLYISPLKALAVDVARNLTQPILDMATAGDGGDRTGDTPASRRPVRSPARPTSS